ncbi:hypothetical protein KY290_001728 [Solanum tuberosum]|uniref:Uncharacterized protein n=1 Tax=Solanum tuberosum TaxID=4113 RepID=A0ABQ7WQA7_SOLTU|nr:hypothetical protein KY290_001728 [Solanum tuberosum]
MNWPYTSAVLLIIFINPYVEIMVDHFYKSSAIREIHVTWSTFTQQYLKQVNSENLSWTERMC